MKAKILLIVLNALMLGHQAIAADALPEAEADLLVPETPNYMAFRGPHYPEVQTIQIKSKNVYDYFFEKAPSDWWAQSGVWEMTSRWSSVPKWKWFGGRSEEVAAIWNKRKFSGDFSIQFYFAFKERLHYERYLSREKPSDAALSFCADGTNLGSGYSLVLGADGNRHSILMKQGKTVAESLAPEALFPTYADGRPYPSQFAASGFGFGRRNGSSAPQPVAETKEEMILKEAAQISGAEVTNAKKTATGASYGRSAQSLSNLETHWWYAKVNKVGNRIECWLDEKLLFAYDDPQPLSGGQFALWTFSNGIVLARVQIFYENEIKRSFIKKAQSGEPIAAITVSDSLPAETVEP